MAEANAAPAPPETRTPLIPINGRRRRLSTKGPPPAVVGAARAPLAVGDRTRFKLPDRSVHKGVVTAVHGANEYTVKEEETDAVHRLPGANVKPADLPRQASAGSPPKPKPTPKTGATLEFTRCRGEAVAAAAETPAEAAGLRTALAAAQSRSAATAELLDALRGAHEARLEVARRRVADLEFELQARKGRDDARSPEVKRQRERAESFRRDAAQARGALDAERAARDAADALGVDIRGAAFVADDVADASAAAAAAAAAREAKLWNAHVSLSRPLSPRPPHLTSRHTGSLCRGARPGRQVARRLGRRA